MSLEGALINAIWRVRDATATAKVRGATSALLHELETRYSPNQPRAPRGTPIGGQWVDATSSRRRVVSEMTLFGRLSKQYRYGSTLLCIYDFGGESWVLMYPKDGDIGCYGIVHQDIALRLGNRLMTTDGGIDGVKPVPAPFTITGAALRKIQWIRQEYLEAFPDNPPVMPGVSLGQRLFDDGSKGPKQVVIAFWRASEFPPTGYAEVQRISGLDLVFKVMKEDVPAFVGKQIDYSPDQAFFLRDPGA